MTVTLSESVQISVPGATPMAGYVARPVDTSRAPGVIVAMELFGVSAHVRDVCDHLAALGYFAVAPDLYHRSGPATELAADADGRARGFELLQQLTRPHVLDDIGATIDFLAARCTALSGMVGLSVGGHVAYLAATQFDLPAVAVLYGGWIPTTEITISQPDPTIGSTRAITARILILVGEHDPIVPPEHRRQITAALRAANIDHELVEYPGAGHGFLCHRRGSYHAGAAADAWQRIEGVLSRPSDRTHSAAPGEPVAHPSDVHESGGTPCPRHRPGVSL